MNDARIEAAARAIHDASGFPTDYPCEACDLRAKVALEAADAVEAAQLDERLLEYATHGPPQAAKIRFLEREVERLHTALTKSSPPSSMLSRLPDSWEPKS